MAGESPDQSEQRKSSGETTPGVRDPRLDVFRETEAEAAAASTPGRGMATTADAAAGEVSPDRVTAVFTAVRPGDDEQSGEDTTARSAEEPLAGVRATTSEVSSEAGGADEGQDGRPAAERTAAAVASDGSETGSEGGPTVKEETTPAVHRERDAETTADTVGTTGAVATAGHAGGAAPAAARTTPVAGDERAGKNGTSPKAATTSTATGTAPKTGTAPETGTADASASEAADGKPAEAPYHGDADVSGPTGEEPEPVAAGRAAAEEHHATDDLAADAGVRADDTERPVSAPPSAGRPTDEAPTPARTGEEEATDPSTDNASAGEDRAGRPSTAPAAVDAAPTPSSAAPQQPPKPLVPPKPSAPPTPAEEADGPRRAEEAGSVPEAGERSQEPGGKAAGGEASGGSSGGRASADGASVDDSGGADSAGGEPTPPAANDDPSDRDSADDTPATTPKDRSTTALKAVLPRNATGSGDAVKPARPGGGTDPETPGASQFVPLRAPDEYPIMPPPPPSAPPVGLPTSDQAARPSTPGAAASGTAGAAPTEGADAPPEGEPPAPLDLLAQLTNTPPPPETPVRTIVRRFKIWTPLVLLLAVIFCVAQAMRPLPDPSLKLTAPDSYAFGGKKPSMPWPDAGQAAIEVDGLGSFGGSGARKPVPIASVAKVMTAYVIMRDHPVKAGKKGKLITIDQQAVDDAGKEEENESVVHVDKGQKITQKEAMQAIMIASANNIARLLARWDAGSEAAFVKKMNAAAKDLGMEDTTYTDPSGLKASTVSTAHDQVVLAKKAMGDPLFREVVRMPQYTDSKGEVQGNWNHLVPNNGVVGIKTGTSTKAAGNLVFAAEKKVGGTKQLIVGAVLGQTSPTSILDEATDASDKLIRSAQKQLTAHTVVKKGEVIGQVEDGLGGSTPIVAAKDVTAVGWSGMSVRLALRDDGESLPHEAKKGTEVGELTVGSGPGQVRVPAKLGADLSKPSFGAKLTRIG